MENELIINFINLVTQRALRMEKVLLFCVDRGDLVLFTIDKGDFISFVSSRSAPKEL